MLAKFLLIFVFITSVTTFHVKKMNEDEEKSYRTCYKHLADQFFENDRFVYIISDDTDDTTLIEIVQSKIVLNPNSSTRLIKKPNLLTKNYLIRAKDENNLRDLVNYLFDNKILDHRHTSGSKFFVATSVSEVKTIFQDLWNWGMYNVIILVTESTAKGTPTEWYWSDPFTAKNKCGMDPSVIIKQQCGDNRKSALKIGFRGNSDCPVYFHGNKSNMKTQSPITYNIFETLSRKYEVKVSVIPRGEETKYLHKLMVIVNGNPYRDLSSQEVRIQSWAWIIPMPEKISALEIFLVIFQREVWIMVAAAFGITLLVYIGILKRYRVPISFPYFSVINLEIFSLTLFGSYNTFPRIRAIRLLLLCYIFYAVVVQTGYISNLIRVQTTPQYEKGITDLNELAESPIPLYVSSIAKKFFSKYKDYHELVRKFEAKLVEFDKNSSRRVLTLLRDYRNVSVMLHEEKASDFLNEAIENKIILDSTLLGHFAYVYDMVTFPDVRFMDMLDKSITYLKETGIYLELEKKKVEKAKRTLKEISYSGDPQVLSLSHVYGTFVIYGVGVCVSCLVFIFEIIVHRLGRRVTRHRLRVLPI